MGLGKTTYTFSITFRFPQRSAFRSCHLACYQQAGGGGQAETESSLALAENVYVILPTPLFYNSKSACINANILGCFEAKQTSVEWKTWPLQLSDYLLLYVAFLVLWLVAFYLSFRFAVQANELLAKYKQKTLSQKTEIIN